MLRSYSDGRFLSATAVCFVSSAQADPEYSSFLLSPLPCSLWREDLYFGTSPGSFRPLPNTLLLPRRKGGKKGQNSGPSGCGWWDPRVPPSPCLFCFVFVILNRVCLGLNLRHGLKTTWTAKTFIIVMLTSQWKKIRKAQEAVAGSSSQPKWNEK